MSSAITGYADLSRAAQVARLRPAALDALRAYRLDVRRLSLLNHGYNTTYRVDTAGGERFALRLNVNSPRTPAQIGAELAWLAALARDTPLTVPAPQVRRDGARLGHVHSGALGRDLPATLFSWLPGRNLGRDGTPAQWVEVGRAAAHLHAQARTFSLPPGTALGSLRDPLMNLGYNLTPDEWLTPEGAQIAQEVHARVDDVLGRLYATQTPVPLHADLHGGNVRWHRGQLSVFDFDDSALGCPVQDLAISAYYLRPQAGLEEAMRHGYASVAALPDLPAGDFETLVAGRALLMLGALRANATADIRALLPRFVPATVTRLRAYLRSGTFRHDVPGLPS